MMDKLESDYDIIKAFDAMIDILRRRGWIIRPPAGCKPPTTVVEVQTAMERGDAR